MGDSLSFLARAIAALAIGLCLAAWSIATGRVASGKPLLSQEPRRPAAWGFLDVFVAFALLQSAPLAGEFVAWILPQVVDASGSASTAEAAIQLANSLAALVAMAASVLFVILRTGARLRDLGFDLRQALRDVRLGLVALVMIGPIVYGIQALLVYYYKFESEHPLLENVREHPDAVTIVSVFVAALVVAPLVEEFLFRVLLQGWMERVATLRSGLMSWIMGEPPPPSSTAADEIAVSPPDASNVPAVDKPKAPSVDVQPQPSFFARWLPIVCSAGVFALLHLGHGPDPIPLFVFALALGYLYQRTGRILPSLTLHFLLNGVSLVMLMIEVYGPKA